MGRTSRQFDAPDSAHYALLLLLIDNTGSLQFRSRQLDDISLRWVCGISGQFGPTSQSRVGICQAELTSETNIFDANAMATLIFTPRLVKELNHF